MTKTISKFSTIVTIIIIKMQHWLYTIQLQCVSQFLKHS